MISSFLQNLPDLLTKYPDLATAIAFEHDPNNKIDVNDTTRVGHLAAQALKTKPAYEQCRGKVYYPDKTENLNVQVSEGCFHRAVVVFDALIGALENRGHHVWIAKKNEVRRYGLEKGGTFVQMWGQVFELSIEEVQRWGRLPQAGQRSRSGIPAMGHILTNKLRIATEGLYGSRLRQKWNDLPGRKLESRLNVIIIELVKGVVYKREEDLIREQWRKEEEERKGKLQRIEMEKHKISELLEMVENWDLSQKIRAFVAQCRKDVPLNITPGDFTQWALAYADRIDPLRVSPPSILDEEEALKRHW